MAHHTQPVLARLADTEGHGAPDRSDAPGARGLTARIIASIERRIAAARLRDELNGLSSRELADMGMSPGDIRYVLRSRFRQE